MLLLTIDVHPSFTTKELVSFPQNTVFTSHHKNLHLTEHQSSFAIITSLQGTLRIKLNGTARPIDPSVFAVVNKGSTLSISINDQHCRPFLLYFRSGPGWENEDWEIAERIYNATDAFKKRIATLLSFRDTCSSFITMQTEAIVRSTLAEVVSYNHHSNNESLKLEVKKTSTRTENYKRLATAREWIEDNFNQPLSLNNLARLTSMNEQHFLRQFKRVFHKTPHQYLIDRRIDEARKLLRSNNLSVQEVCSTVGWESVATFTHLFKQRIGVAPGEYRSTSGSNHVL
jgi:AraC-like DNA-binding protein